jgi:hypothetical protein
MGERRLVALLKELPSLIGARFSYKHFTATRFFPTDSTALQKVRLQGPGNQRVDDR